MGFKNIDGIILKKIIISGSNYIARNKELIDALNVFPVPDGDTGTNMSMTARQAAVEVSKLNTPNISDVAKAASAGSLRGARGNSGVILSQLFRGFAKGLEGKSLANSKQLAQALTQASQIAYKAVMKPKEGTILTVAREIAQKAVISADETDDVKSVLEAIYDYGKTVLDKTPEMLKELKQAGVVDSGGKGLLHFLEGAIFALTSEEEIIIEDDLRKTEAEQNVFGTFKTEDIKFAYCTEFIINVEKDGDHEKVLKSFLPGLADSIVVVADDGIIKVHAHSNHPGTILEKALTIGSLTNLKIDNMKEQHTHIIEYSEAAQTAPRELKEIGVVAVSRGDGLSALVTDLGADAVIEGGQTMNPSAGDILNAAESVAAKNIIILPNNKNIILAAEQARAMSKEKNIAVLKTATIPQGIAAVINFIPTESLENNVRTMNDALGKIKTGQITYAVRDTSVNGAQIKTGDILCMIENNIEIVSKDISDGAKQLIDAMTTGADFISVYYGKDVSEEDAAELADYIEQKYPDCETEIVYGGQPTYYYYFSVE
jgi:DAK2 domain fusion protein YloV